MRIAVNKALDRRRRRSEIAVDPGRSEFRSEDEATNAPPAPEDPERESARRELALLLEDAIDALPEPFRGVYVLREVEGMSTQETAEILDLPPNTVKTRLHRARSLLRTRLEDDFDPAGLEAFPFGAARCDRLVAAVLARLAATEPVASSVRCADEGRRR